MNQTSFLDDPPAVEGKRAKAKGKKEISAPLAKDGQSLVLGSLKTRACYAPRCLVCDAPLGRSKKAKGKRQNEIPLCDTCRERRTL